MSMAQYRKPPAIVSRIANPMMVAAITKLGIRPQGMVVLQVRGRKSGKSLRIPVSPIAVNEGIYLLSPRGEAQWVKNVRAASGAAELWQGRSPSPVILTEVTDPEEKLAVMREYVDRYYLMVGKVMEIPRNPGDDVLRAKLDNHPIFRIGKA
jgi:hypothetical protein